MPKYVVISSHPPNACPSGNKTTRELANTLDKDLAPVLQKYNVKPETMLHLDPGHKILWVLEAPTAEAVRDFVYVAGLNRWNDFEFYMTSNMEELTALTDKLPTIW